MFKYKADLLMACKTLASVIITVLISFYWLSALGLFYAIYVAFAVSLMQSGYSKKAQFLSMLFAGISYLALYNLAVLLRPYHLTASLSLIPLAFIAYYMPNFGLKYRLPPILGVIIYLIVLLLPVPPEHPLLTTLALSIGVVSAISIYFLFWPTNAQGSLALLLLELTEQYRSILETLLQFKRPLSLTQKQAALYKITKCINFCTQQAIVYSQLKAHLETLNQALFFHKTEEVLYGVSALMRLFMQIVPQLSPADFERFASLIKDLVRSLKFQENLLLSQYQPQLLQGNFFKHPMGLRKRFMKFFERPPNRKNQPLLNLAQFQIALLQILDPMKLREQTTKPEDKPLLQFSFALLEIKALYTQLSLTNEIPTCL